MLPLLFMCFMHLLEHPVVLGDPRKEDFVQNNGKVPVSYSENDPFEVSDYPVGYLPPSEEEYFNAKHNKTVRKRSTGRVVNLPADVVQRLMDKPISDLSPSLEVNKKMILDSHNNYRRNANPSAGNMLELVWNDDAEKSACEWAKKCISGHSAPSMRKLPTDMKCGENIFLAPYKVTWDVVVNSWYSEIIDFVLGKGSINGEEVGHYTQVMWGSSRQLGCGMAECPNLQTKYNFVCHYCPPGNKKPTAYPYNSAKPCADCPNACINNLCQNPCPHTDKFVNCLDYKISDTCGNDQQLIYDCGAMCSCTKGEIK